jgi:hypothetical protein
MHVAPGSSRPHTGRDEPGEAALLEALAEAGERLTVAIVRRDHDAIVTETHAAEDLVGRLASLDADDSPAPVLTVTVLAARIGAAARRNAVLLERAWATDAAMLRLLAMAARGDAEPGTAGAYAHTSPDPAQPAGWLDRSA